MILVPLFGGVGNQLFQIARALEHKQVGRPVVLVDCARYAPLLTRVLGWTRQKDWLGIHVLCATLGLNIRAATLFDLAMLTSHKILKPIAGRFDLPLTAINFRSGYDVGYFQSLTKVSCKAARCIAQALVAHLDLRWQGHAAIHVRAFDFAIEDRIPPELFDTFAQGEVVFMVTDVAVQSNKNGRFNRYDGGNALNDFKFIATSGKLLITRSTFGLWAALIAKELGPAEISVYRFSDWDDYLACYTS